MFSRSAIKVPTYIIIIIIVIVIVVVSIICFHFNLVEPKPALYQEIRGNPSANRTYSGSLTQLQVIFVKAKPPNVKSLIRLLKHWKQEVFPVRMKFDCYSNYQ